MTLLPPSASELERNLEVITQNLDDMPIHIRELWDPESCPESLLPWLAWSFSVDDWSDAWTTQQKRQAIKASFHVHQHKGTKGAVTRALSAVGYQAKIKEWFETGGRPGTFGIRVEISDRGIDAATTKAIITQVDEAKNARSHYTLSLAMSSRVGVRMAGVPVAVCKYICRPYQASLPITATRYALGALPRVALPYKVMPV